MRNGANIEMTRAQQMGSVARQFPLPTGEKGRQEKLGALLALRHAACLHDPARR